MNRRAETALGLAVAFVAAIVIVMCFVAALSGCAPTGNVQEPKQTVTTDPAVAQKLDGIQAAQVALDTKLTTVSTTIQKSAQDNDQFRNQVKGGIASLTQNQFRLESWLAKDVGGHWMLGLRRIPDFPDRSGLVETPALGGGPIGDLRSGADSGSALSGAQSEGPVLKEPKGGESVLDSLILILIVWASTLTAVGVSIGLESWLVAQEAKDKGLKLRLCQFFVGVNKLGAWWVEFVAGLIQHLTGMTRVTPPAANPPAKP